MLYHIISNCVSNLDCEVCLAGIGISHIFHQVQTNLVALNSPDFQNSRFDLFHFELILFVENGATVWSGVVGQMETGRVRLGFEKANVSQGCQRFLEKSKIKFFLLNGSLINEAYFYPFLPNDITCSPPVERTTDLGVVHK